MCTINVPSDYPTIQSAINAAPLTGAVICVAAGTYVEQLTIGKSLTLQGSQAGVSAPGRVGADTIVSFTPTVVGDSVIRVLVPDVIIDGFVIASVLSRSFPLTAGTWAIGTGPSTTPIDVHGLQIVNNIIRNNASGIFIPSSDVVNTGASRYIFRGNLFEYNGDTDLQFVGPSPALSRTSGVAIVNNRFQGPVRYASIQLGGVTNAVIEGNALCHANTTSIGAASRTRINSNTFMYTTGVAIALTGDTQEIRIAGNCFVRTIAPQNILIIAQTDGRRNDNVFINQNNFYGSASGQSSIQLGATSYTVGGVLDATSNFFDFLPSPLVLVIPQPPSPVPTSFPANTIVNRSNSGATTVTTSPTLVAPSRSDCLVTPCDANLAACEADVVNLQSQLAACESDVVALQSQLAACEGDVVALQSQLAACEGNVVALEAQITLLQAQLASCQSRPPTVRVVGFPCCPPPPRCARPVRIHRV